MGLAVTAPWIAAFYWLDILKLQAEASSKETLNELDARMQERAAAMRNAINTQRRQAAHAALRSDIHEAFSIGGLTLPSVLQRSTEAVVRHLDAAFARIWVLNPKENVLELKASAGRYTHLDGEHSMIPVGMFKIGLIASEGKPHLTNDVLHDQRVSDHAWAEREGMAAFAGYPLLVEGRAHGVLALFSCHPLEQDVLAALESIAGVIAQGIHRKQAEDSLRKTQTQLERVGRVTTLGELTASIAHEVNQPLAGVVANGNACLRWLSGDEPNLEEARAAVQRIIRDGNRASQVVARIRALLKKGEPQKSPVLLIELAEESLAVVQSELRLHGIKVQTEWTSSLPAIAADRIQLQQVILNLISNAVDSLSVVSGRPRTLSIAVRQPAPDLMELALRDEGIGLPPGDPAQLFDGFYTTKPEGMGMGLAISRSIVEAHGGRIRAIRNDGPGATFLVTLPVEGGTGL